jgi:hypothetical protein
MGNNPKWILGRDQTLVEHPVDIVADSENLIQIQSRSCEHRAGGLRGVVLSAALFPYGLRHI